MSEFTYGFIAGIAFCMVVSALCGWLWVVAVDSDWPTKQEDR